ncbi:uncharacterized protein C8A04DRAFT_31320 [Dichotomopilus funicola]|uniref:Uncharacterized protein n=1 Tax=Dichotomopilus funicola TaxID=1934379 RepID=A0AAN6ZKF4_9PEZI|nr:hypothetical protein C8A04DRAFT_31320 [Dichotomopilus funicola]
MADTAEPIAPSTPSPGRTSSRIRTPPAPQHGYSDSYEPYSPRKSSRIAQRSTNRTPSPPATRHRHSSSSSQHHDNSTTSPKSTKKRFISSMATPAISPQKRRMPPVDGSRKASGTLTAEATAHAAVALGLSPATASEAHSTDRASTTSGAGMLITPAKTPKRPANANVKAKVKSVARNLFHSDEEDAAAGPSKTKTRADATEGPGSFYSGAAAETSFQIFTDSHERIPEVDRSANNPFYVGEDHVAPEAPKRRSKRAMVSIPGEGKVSIEEAVRRDDGMLIVFRGKKQFRKFSDMEEGPAHNGMDEGEGGLESAVESPTKRHFTRSSIKPRLLFPTAHSDESQDLDEEEAVTDIEDHVLAGLEAGKDEVRTPTELIFDEPGTPNAPRFAPASPPTTTRTTRFTSKKAAEPVSKGKQSAAKRSPFDAWRRVKAPAETTSGHKRSGDELPAAAPKRSRA